MRDFAAAVRKRVVSVRLSPEREAEIVDELSQHLEDRYNDLVSGGAEPGEAAARVLAEFTGDGEQLAARLGTLKQARWEDPTPPRPTAANRRWALAGFGFELRQSLRAIRSAPGFATAALVVLTLGIGATTAMVSVVDAVVVRRLPFPEAGRLVAVGEFNFKAEPTNGLNDVAPQNFLDWRDRQDVFTGLAAVGFAAVNLKPEGGQEPEILKAQAVTADFFPVLGVAPIIGRPFTLENERDGNARVAVISYGLWQRRFGGAKDVIGRYLHGQLTDFQIVGVMPPAFAYPVGAVQPTEVWLPNVFRADERIRGNDYSYRLQVIGRLRTGVSIEQAQSQMTRITAGLARETPKWFEDRAAKVESLHGYLTKGVDRWMTMLMGAVGFVMLIACVNLSNLTLARAAARTKELAVRSALGASRWDLARALITESLMLSLIGAGLGLIFASLCLDLLRAVMPPEIPRSADIAINFRVLAATVTLAIATGLICSVAPMFYFSRRNSGLALTMVSRSNTAGAGHRSFGAVLVAAEVALATVLLVGAGLFLTSFRRVTNIKLGLDPHNVLTVRVRPRVAPGQWEAVQRDNRGLMKNVLERVRAIPGVEVASLVSGGLPMRGDFRTVGLGIPGRALPPNEDLDLNEISPEYFRALRAPLVKGRYFNVDDIQGSEPVAIFNEAAARKYFPGKIRLARSFNSKGRGLSLAWWRASDTTDLRTIGADRDLCRWIRARRLARRWPCGFRTRLATSCPP